MDGTTRWRFSNSWFWATKYIQCSQPTSLVCLIPFVTNAGVVTVLEHLTWCGLTSIALAWPEISWDSWDCRGLRQIFTHWLCFNGPGERSQSDWNYYCYSPHIVQALVGFIRGGCRDLSSYSMESGFLAFILITVIVFVAWMGMCCRIINRQILLVPLPVFWTSTV